MVPSKQQAIMCANDDPVHRHMYAARRLNELSLTCEIDMNKQKSIPSKAWYKHIYIWYMI